jgi:hypothetical protein
MVRQRSQRSSEVGAKCSVLFSIIKSSFNVRELATFAGSPEDKATYAKWRRGIVIFYGSVGLVAVAVFLAAHFSYLALQLAGN